MNIRQALSHRLGWKLCFSRLIIVLVGTLVFAAVAQLHAPSAFSHHIAHMDALLGTDNAMAVDVRRSILAAVNEILHVSGMAAALSALLITTFLA